MVSCRICNHPQHKAIEAEITKGSELIQIAVRFKITHDDIVAHLQHGMGDEDSADEEIGDLLSQATDEYSILKFQLYHLRNRERNLIAASPATAESKELISLSRAVNDTVKTLLIVRKEVGQTDDTRTRELEKMLSQLMMILPSLCEKDQDMVERALGIESIVKSG